MIFEQWSDFHVEINFPFDWEQWEPQAPVIVFSGDTANWENNALVVMREASKKYKHVVMIPGNHDYYVSHEIANTHKFYEERLPSNVHFLETEGMFEYDDTVFIGRMGWYSWDFPGVGTIYKQATEWVNGMNDARMINFGELLPRDRARIAADELYLRAKYVRENMSDKKLVITTHTVPHIRGMVDRNHSWADMNGSYFNSFMSKIWMSEYKPDIWTFGHTHFPHDFMDNGVRFVCNPRGYKGEYCPGKKGPVVIDTNDKGLVLAQ